MKTELDLLREHLSLLIDSAIADEESIIYTKS